MDSEHNVDLMPFNTLALPGKAARYQKITSEQQLTASGLAKGERFILGGGSNLGNILGKIYRNIGAFLFTAPAM